MIIHRSVRLSSIVRHRHPQAIARRIAPFGSLLGSVLAQRGDKYEPPVVPVEETPITDAVEQDLEGSVPFAFRDEAKKIIHRVLRSPAVADQSGEYRYMVGTYPGLNGWVAVWVQDGAVVTVERGGRDRPPNAVGVLQDPITLTRPDGTPLEGKAGAVTLRPGGQALHVGLEIDARGVKPGADLLQSVTIRTDATVEGE